jgi:methylmalonyl-CoA mutase N-terminal domain/subunit
VGVNAFQIGEEKAVPLQRIDPDLERRQVERLRAFRLKRDFARSSSAIDRINEAAGSGANLMPYIIEAVESGCTVGEIADSMRKVFGEYKEVMVI